MKYLAALTLALTFAATPVVADCGKITPVTHIDAELPTLYAYAEHIAMLVVLAREVNCDGTWLQQCEFSEDAMVRDFEDVTPGL